MYAGLLSARSLPASRPSPGPAAMLLQHAHTGAVSVYKQAIEHSAITIFDETESSKEQRGPSADGSGMNAVIIRQCCYN